MQKISSEITIVYRNSYFDNTMKTKNTFCKPIVCTTTFIAYSWYLTLLLFIKFERLFKKYSLFPQ